LWARNLLRCLAERDRAAALSLAERLLQQTRELSERVKLALLLARAGRPESLTALASDLEQGKNHFLLAEVTTSAATSFAVLKTHVLSMLERRAPYGEAILGETVKLMTPDGELSLYRTQRGVRAGTKTKLRVCDLYAEELAGRANAPEFWLFEPVSARDRKIRKLAAWLREQPPS
jgi:hypothetical protein